MSHVSSNLDITVTEASRHLQRLVDTGLIRKDSEGLYEVTLYGGLVLSLVPGLDFISRNREYFSEHSVMVIPPKLRTRLGELSAGRYISDTITTVTHYWEILNEAEEFAYSVKTSPLPTLYDEEAPVKAETRTILQDDIHLPEAFYFPEGITRRFLKKVQIFLLVTEKEAIISLPYMNGKVDYCSFTSKDPDFRGWCMDLFLHLWEEAKPNPSVTG